MTVPGKVFERSAGNSVVQAQGHASPAGASPEASPGENLSALRLLICEKDHALRDRCIELGEALGATVTAVDSIRAAQLVLAQRLVDVLLLDLGNPEEIGFFFLEETRARYPETIIVLLSDSPTVPTVLKGFRLGAADHLVQPFSMEEFKTVLERAAERRTFDVQSRALRQRLQNETGMGSLVGRSPAMEKVYRIISKVAFTSHPVLILGESGTGKERVAEAIHFNGPNADKPFLPVDCGALVSSLIESELFGHVKGAFTGAIHAKTGLLAAAEGGTVFLDEIGELPLDLQARLLRALQEKVVRPVGATHSVSISARVLAATNRDLAQMMEQGKFRKDLYYRLNVVNIRIPPLRERRSDIILLAEHFLQRLQREHGRPYTLSHEAVRLVTDYDWPGNVRDLENALEHACALSSDPVLHPGTFRTEIQNFRPAVAHIETVGLADSALPLGTSGVRSIAEMEKQAIVAAVRQVHGDKSKPQSCLE